MNATVVKQKLVSGTCVMFASLFSSGCASWITHEPMAASDLDYFQVDCRRKVEQIAFLQSQRMGKDDRLIRSIEGWLRPHDAITDPAVAHQRQQIASGRSNWLINQHLMRLQRDCP